MPKYRFALIVIVVAFVVSLYVLNVNAQSSDPSVLPLLGQDGLAYLGGFRMPIEAISGGDITYGGSPVAFNPVNNSLFVGTLAGSVAEISIPMPVNSASAAAMPPATYLQPAFVDPTEGHLHDVSASDVVLYGLLVHGNRLIGGASIYYDANYSQRVSHFARSLSLLQPSFSGWSQVWETGRSGMVGGWMAAVPPEWQARLGGPAITGQCCIPIITRTSYGPSAFAFDPAAVGQSSVSATPLLYYDTDHPTLGRWEDSNPTYGIASRVGGVVIIAGTRTALFFGSNGIGPACYGVGTADRAAADASITDELCYDPMDDNKGVHAYPYRYQIWAYDLNDFAAVKAGAKRPWDVVPYGVWPLNFPTTAQQLHIGGVGYDAQRQILYVSQRHANQGEFSASPVIQAFKVNVAGGGATTPANTVSSVTLSADKTSPQVASTPVTFAAQPNGGVAPYQYKWLISDGTTTTVAANWTAANQYVWTPTTANANYQVRVWVRSAGNTADAAEATMTMPFPITAASSQTQSVSLTANRVAPQAPMAAITWTAVPTGGQAPHEFKWLVSDGTTTTVAANWAPTNAFTWTPSGANPNYRVTVWVRSAGNAADVQEASATVAFPITAPVAATVASVALSANKAEPQPTGTSITWTAVPSGGTAPFQYKWFVFDGSTWTLMADWGSAATFTWTPATANAKYHVGVWVKSASNAADQGEAVGDQPFAIAAPVATPSPAPPSPAPPSPAPPAPVAAVTVTQVTLSPNKAEPQPTGTSITWTAVPSGGTAPFQYKWFVFDGSTWTLMANWGSAATFTWTPATANAKYHVGVWVKSASNAADQGEAVGDQPFAIAGAAATPSPAPQPAPSTSVTQVTITSDRMSPQRAGTTVVFTAEAVGGVGPQQYQWWVFDNDQWTPAGAWATGNTELRWQRDTGEREYQIAVRARSAGSTNDQGEATASVRFVLSSGVADARN